MQLAKTDQEQYRNEQDLDHSVSCIYFETYRTHQPTATHRKEDRSRDTLAMNCCNPYQKYDFRSACCKTVLLQIINLSYELKYS